VWWMWRMIVLPTLAAAVEALITVVLWVVAMFAVDRRCAGREPWCVTGWPRALRGSSLFERR
jgi:hypothetical protein